MKPEDAPVLMLTRRVTPRLLLAVAGLLQFLAIPLPINQLLKKSYIDENAFQPGQVCLATEKCIVDEYSHLPSYIRSTLTSAGRTFPQPTAMLMDYRPLIRMQTRLRKWIWLPVYSSPQVFPDH